MLFLLSAEPHDLKVAAAAPAIASNPRQEEGDRLSGLLGYFHQEGINLLYITFSKPVPLYITLAKTKSLVSP